MPFIDIFSLLCTFLLFSAVFVSIGVLEVQIPFLTNAAPPKQDEKPKRSLSVNVSIDKAEIELETEWSLAPTDRTSSKYPRTTEGIAKLHEQLVSLKAQDKDADKATLFVDDDVLFNEIVPVVDAIKLSTAGGKAVDENLFPKVVMGSVML